MLELLGKEIVEWEKNFSFDQNEVYYYTAQKSEHMILSLQGRYAGFDANTVHRIFKEALDIHEIKHIELNQTFGSGHIVAFVDTVDHTYVYRQTFGLSQPESYMLLEKDIADQYKKIGIGSVDILVFGSDPGFEWQIMEVLPGQNITAFQGTQEEYDSLSRQMGRIMAMQYHLPMQGWGRIIKKNDILQGYRQTHYDFFTAYLDYDLGVVQLSQIVDEAELHY